MWRWLVVPGLHAHMARSEGVRGTKNLELLPNGKMGVQSTLPLCL